jgi:hypothetical protein
MVATTTIRHRQTNRKNHLETGELSAGAIDHAVRLIHAVCRLAGSATLIDDIRADLRADKVRAAIRDRNTTVVFDWLMAALSYQGISDATAYEYMARHGRAEWRDIEQKLGQGVSCPFRGHPKVALIVTNGLWKRILRRAGLLKADIGGFCCRALVPSCNSIGCFALMRTNASPGTCVLLRTG